MIAPPATALAILGMKGFYRMTVFLSLSRKIWDVLLDLIINLKGSIPNFTKNWECSRKELYESKCSFCHDPFSTKTMVGPGHKGILKNPVLPASKRPATPENIAHQLQNPYKDMPPFSYLPQEDILNIIAFMNTL